VWCRGVRLVTSAAGREEHITSTDNATVKHFAKLVRNRGYREECGSIVVAGSGILSEVCGGVAGVDGVGSALTLFLAEDADVPPGVTARRIVRAPEHVLKKAAGLQSVDRVDAVAELSMPPVVGVGALTEAGRITRLLALDGIQDPGNLGTLVRTALALGWDAVALLPGTCDPYNDKVRDFAPDGCVPSDRSLDIPARHRTICHAVRLDASAPDSLTSPLHIFHVRDQTFLLSPSLSAHRRRSRRHFHGRRRHDVNTRFFPADPPPVPWRSILRFTDPTAYHPVSTPCLGTQGSERWRVQDADGPFDLGRARGGGAARRAS